MAAARERLQTHPERSAAVFKRYMGSDKALRLGPREFRAEELSAKAQAVEGGGGFTDVPAPP